MLNLLNLSAETRTKMMAEVEADLAAGKLYLSTRLTVVGSRDYPDLLREAVKSHDDTWLALQLNTNGRIARVERRRKPKGGYTEAKVPITAAATLAEGEFNRFFARGLCLVALEASIPYLVVYRAKEVASPRLESELMIGRTLDASTLLADLRIHVGTDTALGLPPGPNSGLSVRLPQGERI